MRIAATPHPRSPTFHRTSSSSSASLRGDAKERPNLPSRIPDSIRPVRNLNLVLKECIQSKGCVASAVEPWRSGPRPIRRASKEELSKERSTLETRGSRLRVRPPHRGNDALPSCTTGSPSSKSGRISDDASLGKQQRVSLFFVGMSHARLVIAVGRPVTRPPPHRSRRAVFSHRALQVYSRPQSGLHR
jgi:hypothetical protein